jgi:hypothetical protein
MFSARFLVAGADRPAFWRAVDRAAVDLPSGHAQIQVTGPLPPYSFVDVRLEVTG